MPDTEQVDVAVIGGGPAGASMALSLARSGLAVALLERAEDQGRSSEQEGWKVGEGLPPVARPLLCRLGVWEHFVADPHLPSYGNSAAWGAPQLIDHSFIFDPHGHGWHLDRRRFDGMMRAAAIDAGVSVRTGVVVTECRRDTIGWRLELASVAGAGRRLHARFVADASGRASWFARRQGTRRVNIDRLVGMVVLLEPSGASTGNRDCDSLTMVEAAEDGWWYASLLADGRLVAVYLSDGDLAVTKAARTVEGWLGLIARTTHLAGRLESHGYDICRGPRIVSANSSRLDRATGDGWVAVGDAAMAYDPLSSQGILAALETGSQAAAAVQSSLQGDQAVLARYQQSLDDHWAIYLRSLRFFYAQEWRWPDSTFWQRRFTLAG